MATLYVRQMKSLNANPIDLAWTFLLAVGIFWAAYFNFSQASFLSSLVVLIWALRLLTHLWKRQKVFFAFSESGEDPRYSNLRKNLSAVDFWRVYTFQSILLIVMLIPIFYLFKSIQNPSFKLGLYAFVWGVLALSFEALADWQLSQFKKNKKNRGKICQVGLWSRSRHPNYFFEWLFWCWPLFLAKSWQDLFLALVPALIMFVTLNFLTGVKITEAHMASKYGEAFEDYLKNSWSFFPKLIRIKKHD